MIEKEDLIVRELKASDIVKLIRWYSCLSDETKRFFHPFPEHLYYPFILLLLSCMGKIRNFLVKVLPHVVYLGVVAVNKQGEVIGFAFVKPVSHLYGDLGIAVRDDYQGRGVGSKLMSNLISLVKKVGLKRIRLTVLADNYRAIRLYEKFGFKKTKLIKDGEHYRGQRYDCVEMWLDLNS